MSWIQRIISDAFGLDSPLILNWIHVSRKISQPRGSARPDPGGHSLLRPMFPHQIAVHRCLGQPHLREGGDFTPTTWRTLHSWSSLGGRSPYALPDTCASFVATGATSGGHERWQVCGSFQRMRGRPGSLRGSRAARQSSGTCTSIPAEGRNLSRSSNIVMPIKPTTHNTKRWV